MPPLHPQPNGTTTHQHQQPQSNRWLLYAFAMGCSGHQSPGLFSHPSDKSHHYNHLTFWTDLAKLLEKGKFDGLFAADVLGIYDKFGGNKDAAIRSGAQVPLIDPTFTVPAMASVTRHLSFGLTATTSYEHPYTLARRFSTLDHLTNGRIGWNVVTGYLDSAARQYGAKNQQLHAKRYEIADEYMDVVYKLWQGSWAEDAVQIDAKNKVYTDPAKVKEIDHIGQNYQVPGPHICEPSLQRTPVIFQAGSSGPGLAFAGKHAEVIFIAAHNVQVAKTRVEAARKAAEKAGRDPMSLKVLALVCPVVAATEEEAQTKYQEYLAHGSEEGALALFGGWTGLDLSDYSDDEELRNIDSEANGSNAIKSAIEGFARQEPNVEKWTKSEVANLIKVGGLGPTIIGSPESVADQLQQWVDEAGVDGFNFAYAIAPGTFIDFIQLVVPVLQKRGKVWNDYPTLDDDAQAEIQDWPEKKKFKKDNDHEAPPAAASNGDDKHAPIASPTPAPAPPPPGFGSDEVRGLTTREKIYGIGQRHLRSDHYASRFTWAKGVQEQPVAVRGARKNGSTDIGGDGDDDAKDGGGNGDGGEEVVAPTAPTAHDTSNTSSPIKKRKVTE